MLLEVDCFGFIPTEQPIAMSLRSGLVRTGRASDAHAIGVNALVYRRVVSGSDRNDVGRAENLRAAFCRHGAEIPCATNEPHLTKSPLSQMGQVALTLTRHISDQQCTGRWKVIRIAVGAAFEGGEVGLAHAFLLQVAPTQSRAVAEPARPRSQPLRRKALR